MWTLVYSTLPRVECRDTCVLGSSSWIIDVIDDDDLKAPTWGENDKSMEFARGFPLIPRETKSSH